MQAKVVENAKGVQAIIDPVQVRAAKDEELTVDGRPVLITRGGDTSQTVGRVFLEFSRRKDKSGQPFQYSKSRRGIIETDSVWDKPVRMSSSKMEDYIRQWFCLVELVSTAVHGEVLILTDKLPPNALPLWMQSRYANQFARMLEITD